MAFSRGFFWARCMRLPPKPSGTNGRWPANYRDPSRSPRGRQVVWTGRRGNGALAAAHRHLLVVAGHRNGPCFRLIGRPLPGMEIARCDVDMSGIPEAPCRDGSTDGAKSTDPSPRRAQCAARGGAVLRPDGRLEPDRLGAQRRHHRHRRGGALSHPARHRGARSRRGAGDDRTGATSRWRRCSSPAAISRSPSTICSRCARSAGRTCPIGVAALAGFTSYSVGHNVGASVFTGGAVRYRIYSAWGLTRSRWRRSASSPA